MDVSFEVLAYRPWRVLVPMSLGSARPRTFLNPEWAATRAGNLIEEYLEERLVNGAPYLTGFIKCELYVSPGTRGVLTVVFSNTTVLDSSLAFREPGGLMGELNAIAVKLMKGLQEREALVECHHMLTRLTLDRSVATR
jgi:hypothetical protein